MVVLVLIWLVSDTALHQERKVDGV